MVLKQCQSCRFWLDVDLKEAYIVVPEGFKACQPHGLSGGRNDFYTEAETIYGYDDSVDPKTALITGPEFGCVHWQPAPMPEPPKEGE